jgi:thiamine pyrophosphate-dependent acetolactate synthase large subunit-like protein
VPIVAEVTKRAVTAGKTGDIAVEVAATLAAAATAPRGPCFVDIPMDQFFDRVAAPSRGRRDEPQPGRRPFGRSRCSGQGGEAAGRCRAADAHGRGRCLLG